MKSKNRGFKRPIDSAGCSGQLSDYDGGLAKLSLQAKMISLKNQRMMRYYKLHRDMDNCNYSKKELMKQYMKDVYAIDKKICDQAIADKKIGS